MRRSPSRAAILAFLLLQSFHAAAAKPARAPTANDLVLQADSYRDGKGVPKDVAKAVALYLQAADKGHAGAQVQLGMIYQNGKGIPVDYAQALLWYGKAAAQGNTSAQKNLGDMYRSGQGVAKDNAAAFDLYQKSAGRGDPWGQNALALMYRDGLGTAKDYGQALNWYLKSANQGNHDSERSVGLILEGAPGVTPDYSTALKWYRRALDYYRTSAQKGSAEDQRRLADMLRDGQGVQKDPSQAADWYRKAAAQGDSWSQVDLGDMYRDGRGVPKDAAQAVNWYRMAAEKGNATAAANLGAIYLYAQGVPQDYAKALPWLTKAADNGNAYAQKGLGDMYRDGHGVPRDFARAADLYRRAQGDAASQRNLAALYEKGQGVPKDAAQAAAWYRKAAQSYQSAADRGGADAQRNLGDFYRFGRGVRKDLIEAANWYRKAADQGDAAARSVLDEMYRNHEAVPRSQMGGQDALRALEVPDARSLPQALGAKHLEMEPVALELQTAAKASPSHRRTGIWTLAIPVVGAALLLTAFLVLRGGKSAQPAEQDAEVPREDSAPQRAESEPAWTLDEGEITKVARDAGLRAMLSRRCVQAGKSKDFLELAQALPPEARSAFAHPFLAAGDYETAHALLKANPSRPAKDDAILKKIDHALRLRRGGGAAQVYWERLTLANAFAEFGLKDERLGMLDELVLASAAREEADAMVVAGHFVAENAGDEFLRRAKAKETGRPPEFWSAYALAFSEFGDGATALAALKEKTTLTSADYIVLISAHAKLGRLAEIEPTAIPQTQRTFLAEALLDAALEERCLKTLESAPKSAWGSRGYGCALRAYNRLDRFNDAERLFAEIEKAFAVDQAPELHYGFALNCERAGAFARAQSVYRALLKASPSYRDVDERLRNLDGISAEEATLLSTVTQASSRLTGKPSDLDTVLDTLSDKERAGIVAQRYLLLKSAGVGGMGIVYRARDLRSGFDVALKKLRGELAGDPLYRREFREEARILSSLSHPNIVALVELLETDAAAYLAMEFVDGETLSALIAQRGRMPPRECARLLDPVCAALAHAHGRGVVHRDLKPGNLMVDRQGRIKVMDFGIAREVSPTQSFHGAVTGTPAFMAPEQYEGRALKQSDLFAVGATAYEMLTGALPFRGKDLFGQKRAESYTPLPADIPEALREIVVKCLKPDPAQRPQSADEVRVALGRLTAQAVGGTMVS